MGKKTQPKGRNPRKAALRQSPVGSSHSVTKPDAKEVIVTEACSHFTKDIDEVKKVILGIQSSYDEVPSCENCRDEPVNKRGNKEKGKHPKKKGGGKASVSKSDSNTMWVCLDCGHYLCGGAVKDAEPFGHARRHAKQDLHPWAVKFDNPFLCWCFTCNSVIPLEMLEGVIGEVISAVDVVDGRPGDNLGQGKGIENGGTPSSGSSKGYTIRGLVNLGNTCFFNSVMQNLFAIDILRDCLERMETPLGSLTMALKKLFVETSGSADSRGSLSPKALFGCISAKAPQFRGYQQQDSHELLRALLDGLHTEEISARRVSSQQEKASSNSGVTFVDAIFGGQLSSTVSCIECGHTSIVLEPFLDLSLPVPSKKTPPKKSAPPLSKKSKPSLRERNTSRKFREKWGAKGTAPDEHHKVKNIDPPAECTECCLPASEPEQDVDAKVAGGDFWLDYVADPPFSSMECMGPSMMPDGNDSVSRDSEVSVAQWSVTGQICENEINVQCASSSQVKGCSKEPMLPSDSFGESSCRDEVPSLCPQDSSVILLPFKEANPTAVEVNGKLPCSENTEIDLDGFGDLFNEPEVTSELKAEGPLDQDMDAIIWGGNSSESNQEEVDNSNAPASINGCLALFTKPELLSNEHAWHCERCSEILSPKPNLSEALNSQVDGGEIGTKETLQELEVEHGEVNMSQKSLILVGGSDTNRHKNEEVGDEGKKLLDPRYSDEAQCTVFHENTLSQDNQESDSCSTHDLNQSRCEGHTSAASSISVPEHTETSTSSSCKKDNRRVEKKIQSLAKVHPSDDRRGTEVKSKVKMVKRDATKRILIDKAPLILTVHLKRFGQDTRGRLSKLSGHVSFQETLELRPYMDPRCRDKEKCSYQLVGVVEHSGSMSGGHYVAYVRADKSRGRGPESRSWFYASDSHVRETSLSEVLQSEAYILFYEKV